MLDCWLNRVSILARSEKRAQLPANGSPAPLFETDDDRLAYLIRLPVHPLAQQAEEQVTPHVTPQVTMEVTALLKVVDGEMRRQELQVAMGLKNADHFRKAYILPAMAAGYLEMTLPDQPNSRLQRYRLTAQGRDWLKARRKEGAQ